MPFHKKKKINFRKYFAYVITLALLILMLISFSPNPEMTEIILFP